MIPQDAADAVRTEVAARSRSGVRWIAGVAPLLGWALAIGHYCAGCASVQRSNHPIAQAIKVGVEFAKATCIAIETPAAMDLAAVTVPGYGPLAVTVARLVCAAFVDDPRAAIVRVDTDGTVTTIDAPAVSSGGELQPVTVYQ